MSSITYNPLPHTGKLAIITGASRGIGAAIAHNLASKGANLLLTHSSASSASATASVRDSILSTHKNLHIEILQNDIGAPTSGAAIVSFAKDKFSSEDGILQIDIIVNNAGISNNKFIEEVTAEAFDLEYHVNVLGPLLLIQAAHPHLPRNRTGRIINVSSISATCGMPAQSIYGGTKAALDAMTRTWARELAERCTVNSINPGPVATRMYAGTTPEFAEQMKPFILHTPLMQVSAEEAEKLGREEMENVRRAGGRQGTPEEVAGVVGMLSLPESQWTTGSVVGCNGGMIMGLT